MLKERKRLESLFELGQIGRREFMKRLSALGLSVALSPALFTTSANASSPKKGGIFRTALAGGSTTDSLNPATMNDLMMMDVNWQLRNNLVEVDHNFNVIPELAENWEASHDAKKWIFRLRKGVEFHNGKSFEAEDVIYSINYHRNEKANSGAKGFVSQIEDIKADGKHTVAFTLNNGNADFPFIMSDYHFSIFPAGTKEDDFEKGIGTGGYILQSWEPGVRVLVKRNPNYWKQGRAHFDEVETLSVEDVTARVNALRTGTG